MKKIPKEFLLAFAIYLIFLFLTFIASFTMGRQLTSFFNLFSLFAPLYFTLSILAGPLSYLTLWLYGIGGFPMLFLHCMFAFIGAKGLLYFWSQKHIFTWLRISGIILWVGGGIWYLAIMMIWYSNMT